ncbi:hypothetical protein C8F01DRAFT_1087238 [Mycena amicta]|nr:hypothetical protein C8F01DRAFT_1087238 [Mycena amicta]
MSGIINPTPETKDNHGIVDGRQAGENPPAAPVVLDTLVDKDAWDPNARRVDPYPDFHGATSKDVYESAGKPGAGMTSAELRHNGMRGRKKEGLGNVKHGDKVLGE